VTRPKKRRSVVRRGLTRKRRLAALLVEIEALEEKAYNLGTLHIEERRTAEGWALQNLGEILSLARDRLKTKGGAAARAVDFRLAMDILSRPHRTEVCADRAERADMAPEPPASASELRP